MFFLNWVLLSFARPIDGDWRRENLFKRLELKTDYLKNGLIKILKSIFKVNTLVIYKHNKNVYSSIKCE